MASVKPKAVTCYVTSLGSPCEDPLNVKVGYCQGKLIMNQGDIVIYTYKTNHSKKEMKYK